MNCRAIKDRRTAIPLPLRYLAAAREQDRDTQPESALRVPSRLNVWCLLAQPPRMSPSGRLHQPSQSWIGSESRCRRAHPNWPNLDRIYVRDCRTVSSCRQKTERKLCRRIRPNGRLEEGSGYWNTHGPREMLSRPAGISTCLDRHSTCVEDGIRRRVTRA